MIGLGAMILSIGLDVVSCARHRERRAATHPDRAARGQSGPKLHNAPDDQVHAQEAERRDHDLPLVARQTHSVVRHRKSRSSTGLRLASASAATGMANQIALYRATWKIRFALLEVLLVIALSAAR